MHVPYVFANDSSRYIGPTPLFSTLLHQNQVNMSYKVVNIKIHKKKRRVVNIKLSDHFETVMDCCVQYNYSNHVKFHNIKFI